MRKLIVITSLFLISLSAKAQSKSDTIVLKPNSYVRIDGHTYSQKVLSYVFNSDMVIKPDTYWVSLYEFIKGSKNGQFSSSDVDNLCAPFLPYVERYEMKLGAEQKAQGK